MSEAPHRIDDLFSQALACHRAGDLARAATLYTCILASEPNHPDSLHLLGLVGHQSGDNEQALTLIGKAIAINDRVPVYHNNLGIALRALGRTHEAAASFRRAVALNMSYAEGHANLGLAMEGEGKLEEAILHYRRALSLNPALAVCHNNLGGVLLRFGKVEEARSSFERAVTVAPEYADAHFNFGLFFASQGRGEQAILRFERAVALAPRHAAAWRHMADALAEAGRLDSAVASYEHAIALVPSDVAALVGLATVLLERGDSVTAAELARRALCLDRPPTVALGTLLARCGMVVAARAHLEACVGPAAKDAAVVLAAMGMRPAPQAPTEEQVRSFYSRLAEGWDEKMRSVDRYFAPNLVAAAIARLIGDRSDLEILDAACGTGLAGELLRQRARRLVGVDLSPEMLTKARDKGIYDHLAEGDLTRFLLDHPHCYDIITCVAALFFHGDLRPVFEAASGALREQGLLVVTLAPHEAESEGDEVRLEVNGTYRHSRSYVARLAVETGFTLAVIEDHVHEIARGAPVAGLLVGLRKV